MFNLPENLQSFIISKMASLDLDFVPWKELVMVLILCTFMFLINHILQNILENIFIRAIKHYKIISKGIFKGAIPDADISVPTISTLSKLMSYTFVIISFIASSKILGFNNKEILYVFGALGIVLSIMAQQILTNFASGIIILLENNIRIGDTIEVDNLVSNPKTILGIVSAIKSRCTIILTPDGQEIIVPNTKLINDPVVNLTLTQPFRRIHISFYIKEINRYKDIKDSVLQSLHSNPLCLQMPVPPDIWITMIEAVGIRCELVVWINQRKLTMPPKAALYEIIFASMNKIQAQSLKDSMAIAISTSPNSMLYSE